MSRSAAEKIVIDDDTLLMQESRLSEQAQTLASSVAPAQAKISSTAFGVMNAFLVAPMNGLAQRTADLAAETAEMADRMSRGVATARQMFSTHEEQAIASFESFEVDA